MPLTMDELRKQKISNYLMSKFNPAMRTQEQQETENPLSILDTQPTDQGIADIVPRETQPNAPAIDKLPEPNAAGYQDPYSNEERKKVVEEANKGAAGIAPVLGEAFAGLGDAMARAAGANTEFLRSTEAGIERRRLQPQQEFERGKEARKEDIAFQQQQGNLDPKSQTSVMKKGILAQMVGKKPEEIPEMTGAQIDQTWPMVKDLYDKQMMAQEKQNKRQEKKPRPRKKRKKHKRSRQILTKEQRRLVSLHQRKTLRMLKAFWTVITALKTNCNRFMIYAPLLAGQCLTARRSIKPTVLRRRLWRNLRIFTKQEIVSAKGK
jgi:hypothetical protein